MQEDCCPGRAGADEKVKKKEVFFVKAITGFFMAWGNFCAIPCPYKRWDENSRKHMLAALPLLGFLLGILWYCLWIAMDFFPIPRPLQAAILTAYPFLISGFIHLDGFMDCSDAILSRRPLEERQRILKDSHTGAFAVIAAMLVFLFSFSANLALLETAQAWKMTLLIVIPVISRSLSVDQVLTRKPLAVSQYSSSFDAGNGRRFVRIVRGFWVIAVLSGMIVVSLLSKYSGALLTALIPLLMETLVSLIAGAYARKQLGGMNGDISGYCIVWCELAAVIVLALE